jgi:prepilin-type processing-associated H-X9-DG protein
VVAQERAVERPPKMGGPGAGHEAMARLSRLGQALLMYAEDWDGRMPPLKELTVAKQALLPYLKGGSSAFNDPITGEPYRTNPGASGQRIPFFIYRPGQVVPLSPYRHLPYERMRPMTRLPVDVKEPWRVAAWYSVRPGRRQERAVLFLDGHVSVVTNVDWPRIRRDSGISSSDALAARPDRVSRLAPPGGPTETTRRVFQIVRLAPARGSSAATRRIAAPWRTAARPKGLLHVRDGGARGWPGRLGVRGRVATTL